MVTLEQIKLLESKLTKAINFVGKLSEENSRLKKQNKELEATIASLKEEKARVEEGIVSALGKLNQFEDAIERSLGSIGIDSTVKNNSKPVEKPAVQNPPAKPVMPSAYTVDEDENGNAAEPINTNEDEEEEYTEELIEDSDEAELDIF